MQLLRGGPRLSAPAMCELPTTPGSDVLLGLVHEQVFPGAVAGSGLCPRSPVWADGLPLPLQGQRRRQPLPGGLCQGGCSESMSVEGVCTQVCMGEKGSCLFIHCKPLTVLSSWLEWLVVSSPEPSRIPANP